MNCGNNHELRHHIPGLHHRHAVELADGYTTEYHTASVSMDPCPTLCDVPPLNDPDYELWVENSSDYIAVWLQNSPQFLQEQEKKILRTALCPFLYGVTDNLPQAWIDVLLNNSIISQSREHYTSPLSEQEMEMLETVERVFNQYSQLLGNKNDLKTILNFIYEVEDKSAERASTGDKGIDMTYALEQLEELQVYKDMNALVRKEFDRKKKQQIRVLIIYYFKTISHHVENYGRDGVDKAEYVKRSVADRNRAEREASVGKDATISQGNRAFKDNNYEQALKLYSAAIEKDHFNSLLYSNRAQTYLALKDFRSALCDSKRAAYLDPKNSKHYFRAAKSYLALGNFNKAEDANRQSLACCTDPEQKKYCLLQEQEIQDALKMTNTRSRDNHSSSRDRSAEKENDPPAHSDIPIERAEFNRYLSNGTINYLSHVYVRAVECFEDAQEMCNKLTAECLNVQEEDQIILSYALGISCVKTNSYHNLQTAIDKFNSIISRTDNFLAAYYGLGLANKTLNRFSEALRPLTTGLAKLKERGVSQVYLWPQSDRPIEETKLEKLKKLMSELLEECQFPPQPDAVCRFHADMDSHPKREIYLTDPDYKGHVCMICRENCCIQFHYVCWKIFKQNSIGKLGEKEILDTQCPTPNCWGLIFKIVIYKPDSEKPVEIKSFAEPPRKEPLPVRKTPCDDAVKKEKKAEKKRLRKERKREAIRRQKEEMERKEEAAAASSVAIEPVLSLEEEDQRSTPQHMDRKVTLLQRDTSEVLVEGKQKATKAKKKEKKAKTYLPVEVQFREEEGKERVGADYESDEESATNRAISSGLLPLPGTGTFPMGNGLLPVPAKIPPRLDQLAVDLYEFFAELLQANGPMDVNGELFQDMLQSLPQEASNKIDSYGGITNFLRANSKFNMFKDHIASLSGTGLLPTPQPAPRPQFSWFSRKPSDPTIQNSQQSAAQRSEELQKSGWPANERFEFNALAKEFVPSVFQQMAGVVESQVQNQKTETEAGSGWSTGIPGPSGRRTLSMGREASETQNGAIANSDMDEDGFVKVTTKKGGALGKVGILPTPNRFAVLESSSSESPSYNSVDEISLIKPLKTKPSGMESIGSNGEDDGPTENIQTSLEPARYVTSSDSTSVTASLTSNEYILPEVSESAAAQRASAKDQMSAALHHSDGSDLSRSASPASSAGSSSFATASLTGSQTSLSGPAPPKPLKAPGINLPSRGKKKAMRGRMPAKAGARLGQRRPSADGSFTSSAANDDDNDVESVASTESGGNSDVAASVNPVNIDQKSLAPACNQANKRDSSVYSDSVFGSDKATSMTEEEKLESKQNFKVVRTIPEKGKEKEISVELPREGIEQQTKVFTSAPQPHHGNGFEFQTPINYHRNDGASNIMGTPYIMSNIGASAPRGLGTPDEDPLGLRYLTSKMVPTSEDGIPETAIIKPQAADTNTQLPLFPSASTHSNVPSYPWSTPIAPPSTGSKPLRAHTPQESAGPDRGNNLKFPASPGHNGFYREWEHDDTLPVDPLSLSSNLFTPGGWDTPSVRPISQNAANIAKAPISVESKSVNTDMTGSMIEKVFTDSAMLEKLQEKYAELHVRHQAATIDKAGYVQKLQSTESQVISLKTEVMEANSKIKELTAKLETTIEAAKNEEELKMQLEKERKQTLESDKQVIWLSGQLAVTNLQLKRTEALFHLQRLSGFIRKAHQSAKEVHPEVQAKHSEWAKYVQQLEAMAQQAMATAKRGVEELDKGANRADLPPISVTPPPMPRPPNQMFELNSAPSSISSGGSPTKEVNSVSTASSDGVADDEKAYLDLIYNSENKSDSSRSSHESTLNSCSKYGVIGGEREKNLSSTLPRTSTPMNPDVPKPLGEFLHPQPMPIRKPMTVSAMRSRLVAKFNPRPQTLPASAAERQSTFEKLVKYINENFPQVTREEIQRSVDELRREKGGSLSGITSEELMEGVVDKILNQGNNQHERGRDILIAKSQGFNRSLSDSNCCICFEDMDPSSSQSLDCGHKFHKECIHKWLEQDKSCPNCRKYVLLQEEYPSLR